MSERTITVRSLPAAMRLRREQLSAGNPAEVRMMGHGAYQVRVRDNEASGRQDLRYLIHRVEQLEGALDEAKAERAGLRDYVEALQLMCTDLERRIEILTTADRSVLDTVMKAFDRYDKRVADAVRQFAQEKQETGKGRR